MHNGTANTVSRHEWVHRLQQIVGEARDAHRSGHEPYLDLSGLSREDLSNGLGVAVAMLIVAADLYNINNLGMRAIEQISCSMEGHRH